MRDREVRRRVQGERRVMTPLHNLTCVLGIDTRLLCKGQDRGKAERQRIKGKR